MAKYAARGSRKRKASKKWKRGTGRAKRRLFRRKRTSRGRKGGSTGGFRNAVRRKYASGISGHFVSTDRSFTFTSGADTRVHLFYFNSTELAESFDGDLFKAIAPYQSMFDLFKLNRVRLEFWLNDNDEWVKQDQAVPTVIWCYDPDSNAKKMKGDKIRNVAGARRWVLAPGKVYNVSFQPRYTITNSEGIKLYSFNKWINLDDLVKDNATSNAIQMMFTGLDGEQGSVITRTHYYMSFKGRRQASVYQQA